VLAALGATLGVSLDMMHVATGTTAYPHPDVLGIAWWVFPLFMSASLLFGFARPVWERLLSWRSPAPSWPKTVLGIAFFTGAYLASGTLDLGAPGKSVVLATFAVLAWALTDRSLLGIGLGLGAAIGGTSFEAGLIHLGGFHYVNPDFAGVAMWLPILYVTVGIAVGNLGKRLVDS
jgi:hypothetical protein